MPPDTNIAGDIRVHYGCGLCAPETWLNFDASPRLWAERTPLLGILLENTVGRLFPRNVRFGDIVRGLPVADECASAAYCSHVLEHLPRDDVPRALKNTLKTLVPGGVFRLVVPDLRWRAAKYVQAVSDAEGAPFAADRFLRECLLGRASKPKGFLGLVRDYFGNSSHLWMYDFATLAALLEDAGFVNVRLCVFGDSANPTFAAVEDRSRFHEGDEAELALEATKPRAK